MAGDSRPTWRTRLGSVRVRTTLVAVAVVGSALVIAVASLILLLRRSMLDDARTAAELRAGDLVALIESGSQPSRLGVEDDEDSFVQILDQDGAVIDASPNIEGHPAVAELQPGESTRVDQTPVEDDPFLVVAEQAEAPGGPLIVLVARTVDDVDESALTIARLAAVGIPLLLVVVGLTTWRVVGRALAPVEAMRREVEAISATQLHRRVPQPASGDEISRLGGTMNRMLDRLQQSVDRQRRFVSDASHELRSPIAAIRQHAEVARAHPDRTDVAELADVVLAENHRMQRLVEDLILLARADEDGLQVVDNLVDLDDLVFEVAAATRPTTSTAIDASGVSAGRVKGDAAQLRRVVGNLVDNAVRHASTRVALYVNEADSRTTLAVEDDGRGIPQRDRGRIFERFVRLDDARSRQTGGSGLGLAIVAEIVAAHGGAVAVGDGSLGGARFEVTFPTPDGR